MKKRKVVVLLLCLFVIFNIISILMTASYYSLYLKHIGVTGGSLVGTIMLFIEEWRKVEISSPQNRTYNFSIGDIYTLNLNVSANFDVESWRFTHLDLKHGTTVNESTIFTPNITINAVRWSNKIIVFANRSTEETYNSSVTFFVFVPNSAPIIEYIAPEIFVCEGSYLSYYFNVTDIDEDTLTSSIVPSNPFWVYPIISIATNLTRFEIISGTLDKDDAGGTNAGSRTHEETVSVSDNNNATCCADSAQMNITVIEINNAPSIETIGVQTLWGYGDNMTFYKQVQVTDTEDGNQDSGNLKFNVTISNSTGTVRLFNITQNGIINFTANLSQVGVYNVSVCAADSGLIVPHQNISLCGQDGSNLTSCENFSLIITNENRAPYITSYYPTNFNVTTNEGTYLYFNMTMHDPDWNVLDVYWYINNILEEYAGGASMIEEFIHYFDYESAGNYTIKAEVTDGSLNDSIEWNVTVLDAVPYVEPSPIGGGGGGTPIRRRCTEKWGCGDWDTCQNAYRALETGILPEEKYEIIKESCKEKEWNEECGYQTRICFDVNLCTTTFEEPAKIQSCYYTEKPSCYDNIKNCHDGSCEVLTDCGGPCTACPTCSDNIKNQGETDVDCGGPCPACFEKPLAKVKKTFRYFLIILIILLVVILIVKMLKTLKSRTKI